MHEDHGKGTKEGPDDFGCSCTGMPNLRGDCATAGCGFCVAAVSQELERLQVVPDPVIESRAPVDLSLEKVVREVQVLRLQPGDVLALKSNRLATSTSGVVAIEHAAAALTRFLGFRVMVIAIPGDANLQVLRSNDGDVPVLGRDIPGQVPLKPVPMMAAGAGYIVTKSSVPGPLSGAIEALATEEK